MHEMKIIATDVSGVCQSVCLSRAAQLSGSCSVFGVIRCSLCEITLASCINSVVH